MEEPSKGQGQRRWKELRGRETLVNVKLKLGARGRTGLWESVLWVLEHF